MMTLEDFARIMQIITGVAALWIAREVYYFNKRKDRESIRDRAWSSQQSLNAIILTNEDAQKASEIAVSGQIDHNTSDKDIARAAYVVFIQLNRINLVWGAWKSGVITNDARDELVIPTLWLYKGNEDLLKFCLSRGYSDEFVHFINNELNKLRIRSDHPKPVKELVAEIRAALK